MFAARPGLCTSICTTPGSAVDHAPVGGTTERTAPVVDVPERVGDRRASLYLLTRGRQRMTTSRTGIRECVRMRQSAPRAKCNAPMRWMGFDVRDHGATFFHYKCEKCGRMGTKGADLRAARCAL